MGHASLVLKLNFGLTSLLLHLFAVDFCLKDNIEILVYAKLENDRTAFDLNMA